MFHTDLRWLQRVSMITRYLSNWYNSLKYSNMIYIFESEEFLSWINKQLYHILVLIVLQTMYLVVRNLPKEHFARSLHQLFWVRHVNKPLYIDGLASKWRIKKNQSCEPWWTVLSLPFRDEGGGCPTDGQKILVWDLNPGHPHADPRYTHQTTKLWLFSF